MAALSLAVPSKGRLKEQVGRFFVEAGAELSQSAGARGYRASLAGFAGIDVMLLSAGEIASALLEGDVHLGITGEDLLREAAPELDGRIKLIKPLGFGFADVVVAVPQYWIDVSTMADLDDVCAAFALRHRRRLRIATKYVNLTRAFFAHAGISDYRIVESAGATEGAPAQGTAEAIVDITTTGQTLAANALKKIDDGTILKSQAQLAASLRAEWSADARAEARSFFARLGARETAMQSQVLRLRLDRNAEALLSRLATACGASVLSRPASESGEYAILCPRTRLVEASALIQSHGSAASMTVQDIDYVFDGSDALYNALAIALRPVRSV
jgi:ATP phosphoribosyltransferase